MSIQPRLLLTVSAQVTAALLSIRPQSMEKERTKMIAAEQLAIRVPGTGR